MDQRCLLRHSMRSTLCSRCGRACVPSDMERATGVASCWENSSQCTLQALIPIRYGCRWGSGQTACNRGLSSVVRPRNLSFKKKRTVLSENSRRNTKYPQTHFQQLPHHQERFVSPHRLQLPGTLSSGGDRASGTHPRSGHLRTACLPRRMISNSPRQRLQRN